MNRRTGQGASRREILVLAGALVALVSLVLMLSDGGILVTRPFWVDEVLTLLVGSRGSPAQVIGDLGSGADGGASLFHLVIWALGKATGSLSPTVLRLFALVCVLGALILSYVVLRRRFAAGAAAAGVLAIGANALVIEHSYEARFYGPWLLCLALVAWLLGRRQAWPTRRNAAALGAAAFALCTIHFYGVITLALVGIGVLASHGRHWRIAVPIVIPLSAGGAALAIVIPLAIAQRVAYTAPSWLNDFRVGQATAMLGEFWLARVPFAAAVLIVIALLAHRRRADTGMASGVVRDAASDAGIVALMALAVMPIALAILSVLGQPSMLSRYAISAVLAWGPWVALAASLAGVRLTRVMIAVLVWIWFGGYTREVRLKREFTGALRQTADNYQQARVGGEGLPIVFASIHVMYPLVTDPRGADPRARFLELSDSTFGALFPDSTPLGQANRAVVLERDLARVHARRWGIPVLVTQHTLDTTKRFLLLAPEGRLPMGFSGVAHYGRILFPQHRLTRLLPDLSLLERTEGSESSK